MRKHAIILILFLIPCWNQSERNISSIYYQSKTEFAITICPGVNNGLLNYAVVVKSGDKVIKSQQLTEQSFMMQITGRMSSLANSKMKNLLKEKVLDTCDCVMDDLYNKYLGYDCLPFQNIWKIRYRFDPRNHHLKEYPEYQGWAKGNYAPGTNQSAYIMSRYNIKSFGDFIVGDHMFLLLKDVQDSVWIDAYLNMD